MIAGNDEGCSSPLTQVGAQQRRFGIYHLEVYRNSPVINLLTDYHTMEWITAEDLSIKLVTRWSLLYS